ncbi:MAG: AEC family transporter [Syntrophobacteraceae bacterium]
MLIIVNSIIPVCMVILLGYAMRRFNLADRNFFNVSDRLIYYIFFPVMLFWKTGTPDPSGPLDWKLGLAAIAATLFVSVLSLCYVKLTRASDFAVGSFSQCCYRFNTYVGMAVILSVFSEEGVRRFGVILVFAIPFINILAVSTLIWFSGKSFEKGEKFHFIFKELISNPLILGCVLGFLYSKLLIPFPVFVENSFKLVSSLTLPMALLSIGHSLETSRLKVHFGLAMASSVAKLIVLPVVGYFIMTAFGVGALSLRVGMVFFTLPAATSAYILSSQLNSDLDLASAGIVLSTLLSVGSLSAALLLFGN